MALQEYSPSDFEPHKLEKEEIDNPHLAFYRLFDFANLPQVRMLLWDWLKITVSGGYSKDICDFRQRHRILYFYEFLEKVIEASHIVYQERKEELRRLSSRQFDNVRDAFAKPNFKGDKELFKLCRSIITLVNPLMIFLLGTVIKEKSKQYYLLIVMPDYANRQMGDYESIIQNKFGVDKTAVSIAHNIKTVNRLRRSGNIFFINNCSKEKLLYDDRTAELEKPHIQSVEDINCRPAVNFQERFSKAKAFLKGAEFYAKEQEYILAAFMLHQATEHTYTAVLHSVTGYREQTHNISKLWTFALLWAPKLNEALPLDSEQDRHLFKLLQRAYSNARYKDGYVISRNEVDILISSAQNLQKIATELHVEIS